MSILYIFIFRRFNAVSLMYGITLFFFFFLGKINSKKIWFISTKNPTGGLVWWNIIKFQPAGKQAQLVWYSTSSLFWGVPTGRC